MKILSVFRIIATIFVIVGVARLGGAIEGASIAWAAKAPERAVTALPGVGAGWLDTLRRVAGPATVEPINSIMTRDEGEFLLGVHEPWHDLISVRIDMIAYARFIRAAKTWGEGYGYQHPLSLCIPAGVLAHEFGHRFQETLWPHGEVREAGDSLPVWAQGD